MARYLVIAFLLPYICILLQNIIKNEIADFLLFGIQAASPSIAAIIEIKFFEKRNFSDYFSFKLNVTAIIIPLLVAAIPMLFSKLLYYRMVNGSVFMAGLSAKRWVIVLWALIAEEFGWRGFLEPSLKAIIKRPVWAIFITGLVWSCWHYHYFIQNGMEIPFLLFAAGAVVESFIYSFFMKFTNQNLLSPMVYHFSWNMCLHLFLINPSCNNGSLIPYIWVIVIEAFTVLIMFAVHKKS